MKKIPRFSFPFESKEGLPELKHDVQFTPADNVCYDGERINITNDEYPQIPTLNHSDLFQPLLPGEEPPTITIPHFEMMRPHPDEAFLSDISRMAAQNADTLHHREEYGWISAFNSYVAGFVSGYTYEKRKIASI